MDPTATLIELFELLDDANDATKTDSERNAARQAAIEHLENLAEWLKSGGFAPHGLTVAEILVIRYGLE